jgi:AraC-like DNA-binding protein
MAQPDFFSTQISGARRFYRELGPADSKPISVVCGGREECAPDYEIHRGDFPYWSVEFVAKGRGRLQLEGRGYRLAPGILFGYGPGVPHDIVTDSADPLVKYFVDFVGKRAESLLRRLAPAPGSLVQTSAPSEVLSIFDDLIRDGLKGTPYSGPICAGLLEILLLKVAETAVPPGSVESAGFGTYQRCRRLLEERFLELRSLRDYAGACRVEPAYLCRLFRRFDHESPYRRLVRLKMNHAAARLQARGMLVKQVAEELGFSDAYHFSRSFKGVFGLAPERFVQAHRGGGSMSVPTAKGPEGTEPEGTPPKHLLRSAQGGSRRNARQRRAR